MNRDNKLRLLFFWCFLLTLWSGYFTYRFVTHERWIYENGQEILEQAKEIRRLIERQ